MSRRVTVGLTLVMVLAGGVLLWWILRGPTTEPPARQPIAGLSDTVSIGWTNRHTALLNAKTRPDALTALGYLHGMTRPWTVTVWRRTALGTLSAAFGDELISLDRHARRLGFGHHARRTYARLPETTRRRLQAYVRGLNAALASKRVQYRAPFVSLSLLPQHWRPWHPLAITRLLAWTGTNLSTISPPDSTGGSNFWDMDRRLRRWLHLHGRQRSIAWAARPERTPAQAVLFARHVLGATAEPILQEVTLRLGGAEKSVLATLPGTLLAPTGTTGEQAWTTLLGSPVDLKRVSVDSARLNTRHERIQLASGSEHLVEVQRYDGGLLLPSRPADSAWVLQWPGLRTQRAVAPWTVASGFPPDSSSLPEAPLFQNAGLTLDSSGTWRVWGEPPVVSRSPHSILVGRSAWAQRQAEALQSHRARGPVAPARWSRSDSSTWAAALLPRMVPDLAPLAGTDPTVTTALTYLRNWTYVYESSSIGAVLFEQWMRLYRTDVGQLPSPSDTAFFAGPRRRRTFRRAVHQLAAQYGADVRQWRWARVAPNRRYFPVWSADSLSRRLSELSPLSTTRFSPLDRPGRGHASTLAGGPTLVDPPSLGPAPTHWEGWMRSGEASLTVRRLRFDPSDFFARSLLPREPPSPVPVTASPRRTTHLVPPKP
ncbi:MAG: penicillin acylase family protein [Salinibacter sp.]